MRQSALAIDYIDERTKHQFHLPLTVFKKPNNHEDYAELEVVLDKLIDEVRDDENHPLALVMQIVGDNLEQYDSDHYEAIGCQITDVDMVKYLMKSYHLQQKDLADIFGSQANVSKFLTGERRLAKKAIIGLKRRFGISADFFI